MLVELERGIDPLDRSSGVLVGIIYGRLGSVGGFWRDLRMEYYELHICKLRWSLACL